MAGPFNVESGKSDQSRLFRTTAWMQEVEQCRSNCRVDQCQVRQAAWVAIRSVSRQPTCGSMLRENPRGVLLLQRQRHLIAQVGRFEVFGGAELGSAACRERG